MPEKEIEQYYPKTKLHWQKWLEKNHVHKNAVWVVLKKKKSGKSTISWDEAVEVALCFGWIDSIRKTLDKESSIQFFSKRKPKGTWSKINKQKVDKLIASGDMTPAGLHCIEIAKQNGSWEILDSVEELVIPEDLELALKSKNGALDFFLSISRSKRKAMLQWLVLAKRQETREKRIKDIAVLAKKKQIPKQF
jgi:uncharacterized protein YdeI (YjbR/CyaY-like superfamily)